MTATLETTPAPAGRSSSGPRVRTRVLLVAITAVVIAAAVTVVLFARSDGSVTAPYRDASATGSIGLCDRAGHQVTSGSMTARPVVWRAVGTTPAGAAYAVKGRSATLYAYQPRAGVDPSEWSGQVLTAAGFYTAPAHPMAAGTSEDADLAQFVTAFPAQDDGFVQLRLYLGAPDTPPLTTSYDALDLHVTGSSWHAVGGAHVSCSSGRSVSFETAVGSAP